MSCAASERSEGEDRGMVQVCSGNVGHHGLDFVINKVMSTGDWRVVICICFFMNSRVLSITASHTIDPLLQLFKQDDILFLCLHCPNAACNS